MLELVIPGDVIHIVDSPMDGLEHLQWAKDFLKKFDGRYKKFK